MIYNTNKIVWSADFVDGIYVVIAFPLYWRRCHVMRSITHDADNLASAS